MKKVIAIVLAVMILTMALPVAVAGASVIQEDEFIWTATNADGTTGQVRIIERMLDEEQTEEFFETVLGIPGITGQEAFIYEVTNVSWVPAVGVNGFSGFNITNVFDVDTVGNAFGPPGWEAFAGYSGNNTPPNPDNFEWDIRDSAGNGLLVGQTGLFGFTVAAGKYIDVHYGSGHFMHSWLNDVQTDITSQADISGPAPFVTKEMDGSEEVELGEDAPFTLTITVINHDDSATISNIVVKDRLGGDLEVDTLGTTSQGNASMTTKGKTAKVFLTWDVGDLGPGEQASWTLTVSPDVNPGGHQEYTETGTHELNSGANAKGMLRGIKVSATSDSIEVEVIEPLPEP